MAKARISSKSINKFIKKLEVAAENIQREIQNELLLDIRAETEKVIDNHKGDFTIPADRIGEFGVGKNNSPDIQKVNNAWHSLLPNPGGQKQVTNIKFLKKKNTFGFQFTISSRFYELEATTYVNDSFNALEKKLIGSNSIDEEIDAEIEDEIIPWMEWFLEGKTIQNFHVQELKKPSKASRTGGALMVGGGLWQTPAQPQVWKSLDLDLRTQLTRTTEKFLKRLDTKRLVK